MRKRRNLLIFVLALIATGWAGWHLLPTSPKARVIRFFPFGGSYQTFDRLAEMLQIGMTSEEVQAILGVPERVEELSSGHRWIYDEVEATSGWLCILEFIHSDGVYRLRYFRNVEHVVFPTSRRREFGSPIDDGDSRETSEPNQATAANAGERVQFRFAVDILWPGMAEFNRSATS